jgi:hypothetical protein
MANIWEPREGETPLSYEKFMTYLRTPTAKRSLKDVAKKYGVKDSSIQNLSVKHRWTERVLAYDAHVQNQELASDFKSRFETQKSFYEDVDTSGQLLIDLADKAIQEHMTADEPISLSMAVKLLEVGYKFRGIGARIGETKGDLETALQTFLEAGWLPDDLTDQLMENIERMREENKTAFVTKVEQTTALLEAADDGN